MDESEYTDFRRIGDGLRLPLHGELDLTYRCNNDCRHCWLRLPPDAPQHSSELTSGEIRDIVLQARELGCRDWNISGGEPMLRPDFEEIFDFITAHSATYTLNTNATLITPRIARLMRRRGDKMVALYGADVATCDHVTRNPGSFEAMMQGIAYLKEAGAGFTIQIIPMRDNYHQFDRMVELAKTLSTRYRVGAPWLYLSADGDPVKNAEIKAQRLKPADVIALDPPDPSYETYYAREGNYCGVDCGGDCLFANCIPNREDFHVDPYGQMSFCCFVKDPALRWDLRQGSLKEGWERFIPSLMEQVRGGARYREGCGSCDLREDCKWCAVYGYLEHRDHAAKSEYLCAVARETHRFKERWRTDHTRAFRLAGLDIRVESDQPFTDDTFDPKFAAFATGDGAAPDVSIRHHFQLPDIPVGDGVRTVYNRPPWEIRRNGASWIYICRDGGGETELINRVAVFSDDHSRARIYSPGAAAFERGGWKSLTGLPTDQIMLARVLAGHQGFFVHSSGVSLGGNGLLFAGHSGAGKSTMVKMFAGRAEILCDDRVVVRRGADGFRVHGSWSHGEVPLVSAGSAPLRAVLFLEQASDNRLEGPLEPRDAFHRLLGCLVRPLQTGDWWGEVLEVVRGVADEVPAHILHFNRDGEVAGLLDELCGVRSG